jgi:hypothetical protein
MGINTYPKTPPANVIDEGGNHHHQPSIPFSNMKNTLPPMFSVYYSDDEHDHFFCDSPSLFEATCEYYYMKDDLEDSEWITIRNEQDDILVESY